MSPEDPGDLRPTVRHGQGRRQELFHPATPGGHHARPVGRLPIPASDSASKNETATSWSREEPQRRSHFRSDAPLSRRGGASPAGRAHNAGQALTTLRRPPASPLPPAGALEGGRCVGRRRGSDRAGSRIGPAGLGPAPTRRVRALRGVTHAQVSTNAGGNLFKKWSWFM